MTEIASLIVALALVAACGVFVAAEFSLVTVDRATVEKALAEDRRGAAGTAMALRTLSTQLSGAQVGITITNLAIGFLAEPSVARLIDGPLARTGLPDGAVDPVALTLSLTLATAVTMIFGELVPKNLAIARPLETAIATQGLQRGFTRANGWAIRILNGWANAILRLLGVQPQEELRSARAPQELASLVRRSGSEGVLDSGTARLLERSISFGDRTAGDIQTHRVQVRFAEADAPVSSVLALARESGLSRFPVTGPERDEVVGLVHVKHAVAVPVDRRDQVRVAEIASPPVLVPSALDLDALSARLRDRGLQMAVVIDEYGGIDGVVTLEDLVEELVGDIADEHDPQGLAAVELPEGSWSLSGQLRLDEVRDLTGVTLPESTAYETVAGLILHRLGRLPDAGDAAEVPAAPLPRHPPDHEEPEPAPVATLTVLRMVRRRVDRVRLTVRDSPSDRGGPE